MVMSQTDTYIEKDRELDKKIKFTAMSPCFLSIFFPSSGLAEMETELESFASETVNSMNINNPGYANWIKFLKKYK